jgi:hypothetical protein
VISLKQLQHNLPALFRTTARTMIRAKWLWIGLAAVLALRVYYIREMIAALMIFSVLFAALAIVALAVFFVDRLSQQIVIWAEAGVRPVVRWVSDATEGIFATPAWVQALPHRFRKELKHSEKS